MQRGNQDHFSSLLHLEPHGTSGIDYADVYLDSLDDSELSFQTSVEADVPDGLYTIHEVVTEDEAGDDIDPNVSEDQAGQETGDLFNFDWIDNSLDQILEIRSNLLEQRNFNRSKRIELDLIGLDLESIKVHRINKKAMISTSENKLLKASTEQYPSTGSGIHSSQQESTEVEFITAQIGDVAVTRKPVPTPSPRSLIFAPHLPTTLNVAFQTVRPDVTGQIEDQENEAIPEPTRLPKTSCSTESTSPQASSTPAISSSDGPSSSPKQSFQSEHSSVLYDDFEIHTLEIKHPKTISFRKSIRKSLSTPFFSQNKLNDSELFDLGWDRLEDILQNPNQFQDIPSLDWIYTSKIDLIKVKILERKRSQIRRSNGSLKPKLRNL